MSLSEENRRIIVSREIEKANANFMQAEIMREHEQWDAAANRLYYAVFHAVNALLIHDRHEVRMLREDLLNQCLPLQRK